MKSFNKNQKAEKIIDITQTAQNYYEEIIESVRQTEEKKKEYKYMLAYFSDIQKIEMLSPEQYEQLTNLAKKVAAIERDKITYKSAAGKLTTQQFENMQQNEDKIAASIQSLEEEEKRIQKIKNDMNHLEGEKGALKIEREEYEDRMSLLKRLAKISIVLLGLILAGLVIADGITEADTGIYILVMIAAAVVITAVIFLTGSNTIYQIKMNDVKLNKAITMLNKVKLLYVNALTGLEYVYEKNNVRNSYEFKNQWNQYIRMKQNKQVYQETASMLYGASEEFYNLLNSYGISDANGWFDKEDLICDKRQREKEKNELNRKIKVLKIEIEDNQENIRRYKEEITRLVNSHKEYEEEILKMVSQYGDLLKQPN